MSKPIVIIVKKIIIVHSKKKVTRLGFMVDLFKRFLNWENSELLTSPINTLDDY